MENHDDIWKKLTTPHELNTQPFDTFDTIKARFDDLRQSGTCVKCPMSGTIHNMPYRRSISKAMAKALKKLYAIQVDRVNDGISPNSFSDFTKLRYWNLIRQDEGTGHWRITDTGIGFLRGVTHVKKYAIIVNNVCKQYMGDDVTINEVLSK